MTDTTAKLPFTGSGDATGDVAVDSVGGALHQYVKAEYGESGYPVPVSKTNPMPVGLGLGVLDIFGALRVGQQNLKIDVQFYRDVPSQLVTVTTTNNGSAASSVGGALFSTSTTAGGTSKGVSFSNVVYHGGSEIFAYFTAMWPTVGIANSYQRIGLYDSNNGAFIGYEGTSWGVTYRNNGSDTTVAKASFSHDTLTGAANSRFRRAGVAEAIDLTKLNVFRIRMGWVGGAPITFEVLSPDGEWVTMHTLRFPNTATGPSIRSADLPITLDVAKTAGNGTDLSILTGCWAAGTTYQQADQTIIGQGSQTALNQNVLLDVAGTGPLDMMNYRSLSFAIVPSAGTVTAGAITFEASNDNANWFAVPLFDATAPTSSPVSSYTVAASTNRAFFGPIHFRYFRARISTALTGTNTGVRAVAHLKVSDVSLPSAVVQETGAALTALQLIDDVVLAEDAAHSSGDKGVMALTVRNDAQTQRAGTDGDYAPISTDQYGRVTTQAGLHTITSSASFTRPADTTAYTSGDVVCNSTSAPTIMTFTGMAKAAGRGGIITAASLVLGSNPSIDPTFDLFLFDTTVTMDNDNAAFTPTDAELATCVAVISLGSPVSGDASSNQIYTADVQKAYATVGATSLYGILVARNAITPTSADTYTIRLTAALD